METLVGRTAFVTGGASGIGLGIAKALAQNGVAVTITGTKPDRLDAAAAEIALQGARVRTACFDVTDRDAFEAAADDAEAEFGTVDILCNNAGRGFLGSIVESTPSQWEWLLASNVMGIVNGLHTFVPRMRRRDGEKHIMATSSAGGLFAASVGGIYTTTKMAVVGMMEALRAEVAADSIGVSVFCPHFVRTNIREHALHAPGFVGEPTAEAEAEGEPAIGMDPLEAGAYVVDGIRHNRLYILSHPEIAGVLEERHNGIMAALSTATPEASRVEAEAPTLSFDVYLEAARGGASAPDPSVSSSRVTG
jgi:NAD(P)-dependent dehydrogenase (short-subunit alcohol dehydrogenase family)